MLGLHLEDLKERKNFLYVKKELRETLRYFLKQNWRVGFVKDKGLKIKSPEGYVYLGDHVSLQHGPYTINRGGIKDTLNEKSCLEGKGFSKLEQAFSIASLVNQHLSYCFSKYWLPMPLP